MSEPDIRSRFIRPSLDPQKLTHFLAVYDSGNFSSAAKVNNVSQQAVSKSIAKLEGALGVKLFERGSFGAEATIFGHALARRAKVITAESRLAAAELTALRGADKGYVRIGLGWSFLPRIAPALIEKFRQRQPGISISITSGDSRTLHDKLLNGDVEFVASAPPVDMKIDEALDLQPLFVDRDVILMRKGHPLAGKSEITLEEYAAQTWLISMRLTEQWRHICNLFLSAGIDPPKNYVDLDSVLLLKSMLLKSDGIALLGKELINVGNEASLFTTIENTDFPIDRTAFLATRRGSPLQLAAKNLSSELVTTCKQFIDELYWQGDNVAKRP